MPNQGHTLTPTKVLPSGVSKINTVTCGSNPDANCQQAMNAGIVGINGVVNPATDYAYAPLFRVALGLAARYRDPRDSRVFNERPFAGVAGQYVTADKEDGSCVVIDFRTMPTYFLDREGYPEAEVC